MSGHSKWSTIKHKKAKTDSARAAEFQKFSRELIVAAKLGGGDPAGNFRLRTAVEKAKAGGLPNDTIKRAIDKGCGNAQGDNFEEITYEGYGAGGVAVFIEAATDNRNRTAGDIRSYFTKYGGNLGETGSVSFNFEHVGFFMYKKEVGDFDTVFETALEGGASNVEEEDENYIITCEIPDFSNLSKALEKFGEPEKAEIIWQPKLTVAVDSEGAEKIEHFTDALEDNDDVQKVYTNAEFND